ncbi:MAG: hypothetical protein PHN80_14755 [Hespellia sp.]|nr:hypothetical protein [Hespellia sp.]
MNEVKEHLQHELEKLSTIERMAEKDLREAPEGSLVISKSGNRTQYYHRTDPKNFHGKYIRKDNKKLAKQLAQKDYAEKILSLVKKGKKQLINFLSICEFDGIGTMYEELSQSRRNLISPYILPEDEYIAHWEQLQKENIEKALKSQAYQSYQASTSFYNILPEIYTEKGEQVRSKSEKILADKFYMKGIPYVYEMPLYLKGYGYIRPDFTVLNKRTRKEYYWEHLGLMSDENYCEKAIKKIECFEKNKIFPGAQLLLTYETKNNPLNMKIVDKIIQEYLM